MPAERAPMAGTARRGPAARDPGAGSAKNRRTAAALVGWIVCLSLLSVLVAWLRN